MANPSTPEGQYNPRATSPLAHQLEFDTDDDDHGGYTPRQTIRDRVGSDQPHLTREATKLLDEKNGKKKKPVWQRVADVPWLIDILSWCLSFLTFMAIVAVLADVDGKTLPQWSYGVTPNTIVQVLATLGLLFFQVPLDSAIGQTKWLRLHRKRPLSDLTAIDSASHGALGSLKLLMKRRGGFLANVGAIVTLLVLTVSPFVQQIIEFSTTWPATDISTLPVARTVKEAGDEQTTVLSEKTGAGIGGLDPSILASTYSGIFNPIDTAFDVPADCSTNNCTWPTYHTLAVRSECVDLTPQLTSEDVQVWEMDFTRHLLPNGFGLRENHYSSGAPQDPVLNLTATTLGITGGGDSIQNKSTAQYESVGFGDRGSVLASFLAVGQWLDSNPDTDSSRPSFGPPHAFECLLQLCIHEMTATQRNGSLVETIGQTWCDETAKPQGSAWDLRPPFAPSDNFTVSEGFIGSFTSFLFDFMKGDVTVYANQGPTPSADMSSNQVGAVYRIWKNSPTGLPDLMGNLASSLTHALRTLPYQTDPARGSAHQPVVIVRVNWPWMTLPLIVLVAGLVLLIMTIVQSRDRKLEPWAGSVLPLLFHGVGQSMSSENAAVTRPLMSEEDMDRMADEISLELADGIEGRLFTYTPRFLTKEESSLDVV